MRETLLARCIATMKLLSCPVNVRILLPLVPVQPVSKAAAKLETEEACAEVRRAINAWLYASEVPS